MIQNSKIEKRCSKCHKIYPATPEYFSRCPVVKSGLRADCKECEKKRRDRYNNSDKRKRVQRKHTNSQKGRTTRRNYALKTKYGVTLAFYTKLFQEQEGKCAICRKPETASNQHGVRVLAVDHDHKTGKVRGLLCDRCNRMIGFARENQQILTKAVRYLNNGTCNIR